MQSKCLLAVSHSIHLTSN